MTVYTGIIALAANLAIVVFGSLILNALKVPAGEDLTRPADYEGERGEPGLETLPATPQQETEREPEREPEPARR